MSSWEGFRGMTAREAGALYMNDDKNSGDTRSRQKCLKCNPNPKPYILIPKAPYIM